MFVVLFGCGWVIFAFGIFKIVDTIVWKIAAGEDFIQYGVTYAKARHYLIGWEINVGIIELFVGLLFVCVCLLMTKKCPHCRKRVLREQAYCHNCGEKSA